MENKITSINKEGLDLIKSFESLSLVAYKDPLSKSGLPITIGVGSTRWLDGSKILLGQTITEENAINLFKKQLVTYEQAVDSMTRDDINQNNFNSLTSFAYNCGIQALRGSTLLRLVNNNPLDPKIKDAFKMWCRVEGKVSKGLTRRRIAEAELYFKPIV